MAAALLQSFKLDEILNEEPEKCRLTLLGTLSSSWNHPIGATPTPANASTSHITPSNATNDRLRAIVRVEKTAFASESARFFFGNEPDGALIHRMDLTESTDIYTWFAGWLSSSVSEAKQPQGDVKVNIICPATDVHVRKYTKQTSILVRETPELYEKITKSYIFNFPPERTRWVTEILEGRSEQDKILFSSSEFIILPDMKWDLHTIGSLYLVAIVRDPKLRSLRDLRGSSTVLAHDDSQNENKKRRLANETQTAIGSNHPISEQSDANHIDLLKAIRREAYRVTKEKWDITPGGLRMWIHYQPSYYHFHVHIVNANYEGAGMGMAVGQAHLLEDVIALLDIHPQIFESLTLTYGLGEQHGLYELMKSAQDDH